MRPRLIGLPLAVLALVAAACTASSAPAWTYAPPTAPPSAAAGASGSPGAIASAIASAVASGGAASPAASGAASPAASGAASPAASGAAGGGGAPVVITAMNIAFTEQTVQAPASVPFTIDFRNGDAGTPHNVAIKDSTGAQIFKGDIVTGVTEVKYQVPALAPGTYQFVCDVHPNMTGSLKVGG